MAWAVTGKRFEIIQALVDAGAEDVDMALPLAVAKPDMELIRQIANSDKVSRQALKSSLAAAKGLNEQQLGPEIVDTLQSALEKNFPKIAVDAQTLQSYVGTYLADNGTRLDISIADTNAALMMQVAALTKQELDNESQTEFSGAMGKLSFEVVEGAVARANLAMGGSSVSYRRLSDVEAAALPAPAPTPVGGGVTEVANDAFPASSPESQAADLAISSPNWAQFRGQGARGIADGQSPPTLWNHETHDNLAWKTAIPGLGHSCPVVWGDRLFLTTAVSGKEADLRIGLYGDVTSVDDDTEHEFITLCLNAETGEVLWQNTACKKVPRVKRHLKSTHANSTVATDGQYVVAWFGSEGLFCYSLAGELIWQKDLGLLDSGWFYDRDYQWQFGASPIIHDGRLILQCDIQDQSFLAMLDLATGQEIWRTNREEIPSWSTPTVVSTPHGLQIVANATGAARGYDFSTGQERWKIGKNSEIAVPTPFSAHGLIFISSGYRPIQPIYAIRLDAAGDLTLAEGSRQSEFVTWSETSGGPYMPTPIVYGDYLYVCSNSGILTCYQALSGKLAYKKRLPMTGNRSFVGSPVAADGQLYFTSEEGETAVVKAGPTFELIANNTCGESCLTTPAISRGRFFLRGQRHLFAFQQSPSTEAQDEN